MQQIIVEGMTCQGCVQRITKSLLAISHVKAVQINLLTGVVSIETNDGHVSDDVLKSAVREEGFSIVPPTTWRFLTIVPWFKKFTPLIGAFSIVTIWTMAHELNGLDFERAMVNFMGGFFLLFGGTKILNWGNFARSFSRYDPVAQRSRTYAYLYPAIEVGLGVMYLLNQASVVINCITVLIMGVGAIGVSEALKRKQDNLQCACLGGFFNISLSGFTVLENLFMGGMAFLMLLHFQMGQVSTSYAEQVAQHHCVCCMAASPLWHTVCWVVGVFYAVRLMIGTWWLPKFSADNEVSHGLMAIAMADMFSAENAVAELSVWRIVFWGITLWYTGRVVHSVIIHTRVRGHLIHFVMAAGMVYMLYAKWFSDPMVTYGFALFFATFTVWYFSVEIVADWNAKPRNILWVLGDVAHAVMGWGMAYMLIRM